MDSRFGSVNSLGSRIGEQLHDGWIHPHFNCNRDCSGSDPGYQGAIICIRSV